MQTVLQAGDEVIIFDPSYDSYAPCVKLLGAKSRSYSAAGSTFSGGLEYGQRCDSCQNPHDHHQHTT